MTETLDLEAQLAAKDRTIEVLARRVEALASEEGWAFSTFEQNLILERAVAEKTREIEAQRDALRDALVEAGRLGEALTHTAEAVLITDVDGTITYVNPAFEEVTGYAGAEVLGQTPRVLRSGHHPDTLYTEMWNTILSGRVWKGTLVNRKKDGGRLEVAATISPVFDAERAILGFVALERDVTQERELELQLRAAQKLQAVGALAAGVAHEINTPIQYVGDNTRFLQGAFRDLLEMLRRVRDLTAPDGPAPSEAALSGLREALEALDADFLAEEVPEALSQALEGVGRVSTIVRAMKCFDPGGSREQVDLNEAIESTLTVCRNEYKHVAEVVRDLDPALPPVTCVPGEINQVILNLVMNAAQAVAEVADVTGAMGTIEVGTRGGDCWVGSGRDSGPGVPEEVRDHIFEPFFTTKPVGVGTGQGLNLVHSIVEKKHGGTVRLDPAGPGARFVVRLPNDDA